MEIVLTDRNSRRVGSLRIGFLAGRVSVRTTSCQARYDICRGFSLATGRGIVFVAHDDENDALRELVSIPNSALLMTGFFAAKMSTVELKEVLNAQNGLLFYEEALSPVFCKPKLIPLKSVTLEKLEKMQRESMEAMKQIEEKCQEASKTENTDQESGQHKAKSTDIWTAEENQEAAATTTEQLE